RGEHAAAVEFARAAVEIAAATDALLHHANARLALATALRAAGRDAEADAEERRAIELWEAKGATLLVERARLDAGRVVPIARPPEERAAPPLWPWRRVPQNAATANLARFDAANAARDIDASRAQLADDLAVLHHPTGVEIGLEEAAGYLRPLMGAENFRFTHAPIATLVASLALSRPCLSVDALATDDVAPFGAANIVTIALLEVDAHGRERRVEVFADDRLGDAVTRLYERYAELLPEGPERTRAGATAHAVA